MPWTFYNSNGQKLSTATTLIDNLDIDGATDIGEDIADGDLLIIDNGAGGTNRKTTVDRIKTYVNPLTLRLSGSTTVGANGKTGVSLASAAAGPTPYIWDAWIATDDAQVAIPLDFNANETISPNIGTFLSRYSQTAGSTTTDFVIVNGSASSRTIVYRVYEVTTP